MLKNNRLLPQIVDLASRYLELLEAGGNIIFCGNRESLADAQHLPVYFIAIKNTWT